VIGYAKPRGAARLPPAKTSIARVPGNEQTSLDDERGSLWRERGVVRVQGHAWEPDCYYAVARVRHRCISPVAARGAACADFTLGDFGSQVLLLRG